SVRHFHTVHCAKTIPEPHKTKETNSRNRANRAKRINGNSGPLCRSQVFEGCQLETLNSRSRSSHFAISESHGYGSTTLYQGLAKRAETLRNEPKRRPGDTKCGDWSA